MVAAGEAGGILDTILLRLATFLEKNDALVRKVKGAMVYPGVIISVAGVAIAVLLIFVIPTFESMFASAGMALPLPTRIVIGMSNFLHRLLVGDASLGIGGVVFALRQYYATPNGRLADRPAAAASRRSWATCSGSRRCRASPGRWAR